MPFRGGTRHQPTAGRTRGDAASFGSGRSSTTGIARGTNTAPQITAEQLHPRSRGLTGTAVPPRDRQSPGDHGTCWANGGFAGPGATRGTAVPAGDWQGREHGDLLGQRGFAGPGGTAVATGGSQGRGDHGEQLYQREIRKAGGTVIRGDHGGSQGRSTTGALRTGRSTDGTAVQRGSQDMQETKDKQGTKDKHGRSINGDPASTGTQHRRTQHHGDAGPTGT